MFSAHCNQLMVVIILIQRLIKGIPNATHAEHLCAKPSSQAVPLYLVASADAEDWLSVQGSRAQNSATSQSWNGKLGQILCVTENGLPIVLAIGFGDATARSRNRFGWWQI